MKNQNYIKLLLQWILSQVEFGISEINKLLRGNVRYDLKDVRLSLQDARLKIKDALANDKDASNKNKNVSINWDTFITECSDKSELIWLANCELDEIMKKYGLKKRASYNWRVRARIELGMFKPCKEYPNKKFKGG